MRRWRTILRGLVTLAERPLLVLEDLGERADEDRRLREWLLDCARIDPEATAAQTPVLEQRAEIERRLASGEFISHEEMRARIEARTSVMRSP